MADVVQKAFGFLTRLGSAPENALRRTNKDALFIPVRPRRSLWVHSTIRVTHDTWRNWSRELSSTPVRLYCDDARGPWKSPRTLEDLQAIVREARAAGQKVRVFGSSHSWSPLVPTDGFLVDNRLIGAQCDRYEAHIAPACEGRKARATVPSGLLSSEFEHWLWKLGYTLPASAFEDCFTIGGMASTATHGVGLDIPTVSDMVVGATFVDGHGNVRRWSRETASPEELAAVQCGLGCLGLVYTYTFEVEPRYEVLHTAKTYNYESLFGDNDEARRRLRDLHNNHHSIEFFWWPFVYSGLPVVSRPAINPDVWVLATQRVIPQGARLRGPLRRFLHLQFCDFIPMASNGLFMRAVAAVPSLSPMLAWITCFTNLWVKVRSGSWRMPQYDANHFVNAAGVEFTLAIASEWSVPFNPNAPDSSYDGWERVRQSFDVLHQMVVDDFKRYPIFDPRATPITIAIEMRTLAASSALMSPSYEPAAARSEVRYAAPEIVTVAGHPAWTDFAHRANIAMLTNPAIFGTEVRCHHGKPSHSFPHPDYPEGGTAGYLRDSYQRVGAWELFLRVRETLDPDGVFLNDYLRSWFYPGHRREDQAGHGSFGERVGDGAVG